MADVGMNSDRQYLELANTTDRSGWRKAARSPSRSSHRDTEATAGERPVFWSKSKCIDAN